MIKRIALLLIILSLPLNALFAESIFLKDGSIIEADVIRDTRYSVTYKTPDNQTKVIKRDQVLRILYNDDYKEKKYIYKNDMSFIPGYVVYEDQQNYFIRKNLTDSNEIILPKSEVVTVSKRRLTLAEKREEKEKTDEPEKSKKADRQKIFNIDWGIGATFGMFRQDQFLDNNFDPDSSKYNFLLFSAADLRAYAYFDFRFNIVPIFSAGAEIGVATMLNIVRFLVDARDDTRKEFNDMGYDVDHYFLLDFPFRGFVRVGNDFIYGQIFGGYYLSVFPMATIHGTPVDDSGPEVGARLVIKNLFLEFSYVFSDYDHVRLGIGYEGKLF